jgi:hypothetical protein
MAEERSNRVHRELVAGLGDALALEGAQTGWLSAEDWARAIERVRLAKFPDAPASEAARSVGRYLGEGFLASPDGALIRESLLLLSGPAVFGRLVPTMGSRLRQSLDYDWALTDRGGQLSILGRRVNPPEVTLGFFEAMAAVMTPSPRLQIAKVEPEVLTLSLEW